ncbi:FAD-dependent oxidoreductase [Foetidibacter luteolus]|uniref:FAD-dependent oxidoreductase n=1 Tax=Foetidibacter luteolus TaxID=2608880 RepID=UPI00129AD142|nr:FAD-dependent oxidoreductase [Foetidibacter luteolus]
MNRISLFVFAIMITAVLPAQKSVTVDVCVYGGTSAGVMAAYTAKKLNKTVLLIEPGKNLGGLTTGGLGYTDIGNKYAITGLSRNFYRRIGKYYGRFEQWIFEPHVAEETFQQYIKQADVEVLYNHQLKTVVKVGKNIQQIITEEANSTGTQVVKAAMFIDCSYEGDLMAKAGVSYTVGREANSEYGETYNGVQLRNKHQFPEGVDPYKIPGKPESGLLWGISNETLAPQGAGDQKVQAYNFRICLTSQPENAVPVTRPADYDSTRYDLLLRVLEKINAKDLNAVMKIDHMPNHKTDINNNGAFSTDMIGMNYDFPEADYAKRKEIFTAHENYVKGFLYFIGHDSRMPEHLRKEMLQWGYPKDEYVNNNHWSPQMYVREARRMKGAYIMTQANCEGREVAKDAVGMAAYTMDSHNCQRLVVNGQVKNEGDVQVGGFGPYPIAYQCLVPKQEECNNLLVPVCLSATHIAYGSIRMEPVFMVLAQSAATAAVEAINSNTTVQQVNIKKVQQMLAEDPLADGSTAEILVDNDDSLHVTSQGDWKRETKGTYGPSMFVDESNGATTKFIRFVPQVVKAGRYHVYTYLPKISNMASQINFTIFDGKQAKPVPVSPAGLKVEGQTSGEWIDLGVYHLNEGRDVYVEVNNRNADGAVVADAVLFIPEE